MRTRHFWKLAGTTLILALGLAPAGCNSALEGAWKTDPVPEGEAFYIIEAQFKEDGTYTASARQGEALLRLAGTYDFNGFTLRLKTPGKPMRKYSAVYLVNKRLRVSSGDQTFTMKKQ